MARTLLPALAALPLLAAQAPAPLAEVPIALSSYRIEPKLIHLSAGVPVRLTFTNASTKGHDFSAPGFFARASQLSGEVPRGEIDLAGHGTTAITLVPARGTYKAWCGHFGHKLLGMTATIVVE